jgi:hypothetical protein
MSARVGNPVAIGFGVCLLLAGILTGFNETRVVKEKAFISADFGASRHAPWRS